MLHTNLNPPSLGSANRRAFKAAALTVSLAGGPLQGCTIVPAGASCFCIRVADWRLTLLPTACERRPLFLSEASEIAVETGEDVMVVRLDTLEPPTFVTFDVLTWRGAAVEAILGLAPCILPGDPRLWLGRTDAAPSLFLAGDGLHPCPLPARVSQDEQHIGTAAASDFYRRYIWGDV